MIPSWIERYREIIPDWSAFADALSMPLPTCIVANTLRIDRADLIARLERRGTALRVLEWTDDALVLDSRRHLGTRFEYLTGLYNVQEEAAVIPVRILDPQPGERVLDLCAAPGNKTAQIAVAMRNRGTVVANDRSVGRLRAARAVIDRMGLANVCMTASDGTKYPRTVGTFDRVLADVPCSCEGTSRKSPGVLDSRPDYAAMAPVQRNLLRRAFDLCRPGGVVVYSTCTYAPEENEEVVDDVVASLPYDVEWLPCRLPGFAHAPGLSSWSGRAFDPRMERAMRVWPHLNDTGGFFVAAFRKSLEARPPRTLEPPRLAPSADAPQWLALLQDQFGWADLSGWTLFEPNRKTVGIASADMTPPAGVTNAGIGVGLVRKAMAYPRPTTAAAMLFGARATRGVVDVAPPVMDAFLRRRDVEIPRPDGGGGHVLLRCEGVVAGIGRYRGDTCVVESFYPGAWALGDDASAFEVES